MRKFIILLLLAFAHLAHAETVNNTFTSTGVGTIVYLTSTPPVPTIPQTGTYTLAGTFVGTMQWEYTPNGQNFVTLNTYTTTVGPVNMSQPGYYRWECTAYASGTITATIFRNYLIYQQQYSPGGTLLFQVDDSGFSGKAGSSFPTGTVPNGGTGLTSMTPYALLAGGTTATGALQQVSGLGTSGYILTSNGASALPTWQAGASIGGSIASTQVPVGSGTNTIAGSANFTEALGQLYISSGASGNGLIDIDSPTAASSALEFTQNTAANKNFELYSSNTTTFSLYDIVSTEDTLVWSHANQTWTLPITTASSSTTTGAFIDSGGLGVAGAEWVGGLLNVAGAGTIQGVLTAGGTSAPSANSFAGNKIWGRNNAAADTAGAAGETFSSFQSAVAAGGNGTTTNIASVALTAGKWLLTGQVVIHASTTGLTVGQTNYVAIATTNNGLGTSGSSQMQQTVVGTLNANALWAMPITMPPVNLSASQTYYLNINIAYNGGSPTIDGLINAVRLP